MSAELSRPVRVDTLSGRPREMVVTASPAERSALAERFAIAAVERLEARVSVSRDGETVTAKGRLRADVEQSCVVTDIPVASLIDEPFSLIFRPEPHHVQDEVELAEAELDVLFYQGSAIDIGEAIAETLSLSLDPFPRGPEAEGRLREAGVQSDEEAKPAGALAGLKALLEQLESGKDE